MKILFLDDEKIRHERFEKQCAEWMDSDCIDRMPERADHYEIVHAYRRLEAILLLGKHEFDEIWLDHDLGGPGTGMDVVDFLCKYPEDYPGVHVFVHSMNIIRADEMVRRLVDAGYPASRVLPP